MGESIKDALSFFSLDIMRVRGNIMWDTHVVSNVEGIEDFLIDQKNGVVISDYYDIEPFSEKILILLKEEEKNEKFLGEG